MLERLRATRFDLAPGSVRISGARWRALGGLAIMLAAIAQSAANLSDPTRLKLVAALALIMTIAWFVQLGRWSRLGVWLLGGAACLLMLLAPGPGAVIAVISALVIAGMRLPASDGIVAAAVLGPLFVAVDAWEARGTSSLIGTAFTATGLTF